MRNNTAKKLAVSIAVIIILSLCLVVSSAALVYSIVSVEGNIFVTGIVSINLNNGVPIIKDNEFLFEPGMTVKKDFFILNESTCDVYYKLYFTNVLGGLADMIEITVCDGDRVLYEGTPAELDRKSVGAANDILKVNEKRDLQIYFHFPEEVGNEGQDIYLSFDFAADAVQTKNNANREFD